MKLWFFTMKKEHFRTGEITNVEVGVIKADTAEEAENKVWEALGSDYKFGLTIEEITTDLYSFNVYRSQFN